MIGRRVPDGDGCPPLAPGDYGRHEAGFWVVCTPNGHAGNLSKHTVTEHEDGTITVAPSILVSDDTGELYHGFLQRGVWS